MGESFIFLSDFLPEMDPSSGVTIFLPSLPLIAVLGGGRGGPPPKCFCPLCSKRLLAGEVNIFAQSLEGKRKGEEDKLVPSLSRLSERKSHFAALIPDWHHLDAPPLLTHDDNGRYYSLTPNSRNNNGKRKGAKRGLFFIFTLDELVWGWRLMLIVM